MGLLKINISDLSSARWSYDSGSTWQISGTESVLAPGTYSIIFNTVSGYNTPSPIIDIQVTDTSYYEKTIYYTEIESSIIFGVTNFNDFCEQYKIQNPSFDTSFTTSTNTLIVKFGDGYSQRGLSGLHSKSLNGTISWTELELSKIKLVEKYVESRNGIKSFLWTPPRYEHRQAKRFIAKSWSRGYVGFNHDSFSITIEQVFDIS